MMKQTGETISLQCEISIEDKLDFSLYHAQHSPALKNARRLYELLPSILWMLAAVLLVLLKGWNTTSIVAGALLSIASLVWIPIAPKYWLYQVRKRTKKLLSEGQAKSREEVHYQIAPEGIRYESEIGEGIIKWSAVQKVVTTSSNIYLYVSAVNAVFIPKSALAGEISEEDFRQAIQHYREKAVGLISSEAM